MPALLSFPAAFILLVHGLIHLIGTIVYMKLGTIEGFAYKTTIVGGRVNLGEIGTAIFGALWLVAAIGFTVVAVALAAGWEWWRTALVSVTLMSLALTALDWTVAYAGVIVNLVVLAAFWLGSAMSSAVDPGADRTRTLPADAEVPSPTFNQTLAITIDAPPEAIWPWLVQMGYRRGGLYSYDWLDRLFGYLDAPSADRILPEFQHLKVGDEIPIGRGGGFPVAAMDQGRLLALGGGAGDVHWSWQLVLNPIAPGRTRLVSRSRGRTPAGIKTTMMMAVMESAAFIMTRRMLLGIKWRAETLRRKPNG